MDLLYGSKLPWRKSSEVVMLVVRLRGRVAAMPKYMFLVPGRQMVGFEVDSSTGEEEIGR